MNDSHRHPAAAVTDGKFGDEHGRRLVAAAIHWLALAGLVYLSVERAPTARWDMVTLAIIAGFAVVTDVASVLLPSGQIDLSGSLLAITLAAVLLGGTPAAIVGVLVIVVSWPRTREALWKFGHNLINYGWFALLSGLLFHQLSQSVTSNQPTYYLLAFLAFIVAVLLNFVMAAGYLSFRTRSSFWHRLTQFKPVLGAELASGLLMLVAVYLTIHLGTPGLLLFALVLVIFQYLVGELLTSERRGQELRVLATTDELTGLANRKHFGDRLTEEIERAGISGQEFGVLLLDLDRFKDVNDTLGHAYGDALLRELAERLARRTPDDSVIARLAGDEFAILPAHRTGDATELAALAERALSAIMEPLTLGDVTLELEASVGAVRFPIDGDDAQTLLRRLDIAMHAAKEHHERYRLYEPSREQTTEYQLRLLADFRRALERDELVLHYHPIIDLDAGRVSGAEALVRWQHPEHGLLQPGAFVALVEQTGMIGRLTETVLEKAISECAGWRADGQDLSVAVNLSVRNLLDPGLPAMIRRKLSQYRLSPQALKLEITESMIMSDPERAIGTVQTLSALGVRFAVDDFGTGYSSLANLRRLPVHELKIDRSFVTPMLEDESDLVIVRSTIDLGHALGLQVIAEGVEDAATLKALAKLGCDRAQGHFMSTPMPADHFPSWTRAFEHEYRSAA